MIGRIRGQLIEKQPPYILVDVNGVGYEIEAPASTLSNLPELGEQVTLHTHLIVREDAQVLCGFISEQERQLFRHLIKVNSVGAKLALGILSGMSVDSSGFSFELEKFLKSGIAIFIFGMDGEVISIKILPNP